jgi:iron(III) transport system permease protein
MFLAGAGLVIGVVIVMPLLVLIHTGMRSAWSGGTSMLLSQHMWALFARSLGLSLGATSLAVVAGVPLGVLMGRCDVYARRVALALHSFPLFLSPFLLAMGSVWLFGASGTLNSLATSPLLFSEAGVIVVLAVTFTPLVTLLTALALRGIDPTLEEAGRIVANPPRVIRRILLPIAAPAVSLAAMLVFSLAFSELGVPMFFRVRTYPASVFVRLGGFDYSPGEAVVLVLPMLIVGAILLLLERRIHGGKPVAVLGARTRERPILPLGKWRLSASVFCWVYTCASLLPIMALINRAGMQGFVSSIAWIDGTLWHSMRAATIAATVSMFVGVVIGHAIARRRSGSGILDAVTMLAFLTPASVIGVGLIATWNRPGTQVLYATFWIIVIALVARYVMIAVRASAMVVAQTPPELEESAAVFGASFAKRLRSIVLPVHRRGFAAAWLFTMVFCFRDLDTVILLYPPGGEPLPVRIFTLEANGPEDVVAALAVLHIVTTAAVFLVAVVVARFPRVQLV